MIQVTKLEKDKLLENGCKFHHDIFKTYSKHPKYYLKESKENLSKLNKIKEGFLNHEN